MEEQSLSLSKLQRETKANRREDTKYSNLAVNGLFIINKSHII
ncbi:hypothetical protein J2S15_001367 [Breznakia pachnodae]|uniref:Uncharacterized protein n=1 Tax=Breznakia pachnodae TaxID=265178 RepID=A0ABU0E166_9FIRM|nr:hypothetical protein [Breznakia pachnodae]